jgi:hypothetical protein
LWLTLATPRLELKLGLEELAKVKIHEEIIPELLDALVREISSDGEMRHPVIVDASTLVVLDGMHRVAALRELGCSYLPVCLVDYRNPHVHVGSWYRSVRGEATPAELLEAMTSLGLEAISSSLEEALQALDERSASFALLTQEGCHLLKGEGQSIRASYAWIKRAEDVLRARGLEVDYEVERDARRMADSGEVIAALATPRARKEEVIAAGLRGEPFPHKTTRHVLPARPMRADVPLEWLLGGRPLREANELLVRRLSERRVRRLPGGSEFEGRRYEEELWVFE